MTSSLLRSNLRLSPTLPHSIIRLYPKRRSEQMSSVLAKALDPQRTLLLVCDVQAKFRHPIYRFADMCLAIRKMTKAAAILEMPIMVTEQHPTALGATVDEVGLSDVPSHLLLGVHPKTKFSMFVPPIQEKMEEKQLDTAIIVGIESHICVLQSTLDLLADDKRVFVLVDAVSSVHKQEIGVALEVMKQAGAVVTTSESLLFRMMRDASAPNFKPFVKLVKEENSNGNTEKALEAFLGASSKADESS